MRVKSEKDAFRIERLFKFFEYWEVGRTGYALCQPNHPGSIGIVTRVWTVPVLAAPQDFDICLQCRFE